MVSFPEDKRGEATWVHWVLEAKVASGSKALWAFYDASQDASFVVVLFFP